MQWPGKIAEQEANGDQIEKHAEGAGDAVMRNPPLAIHIANGDFADRRPVPRSERRNKTMQLAVERHLLQDLAAISFEGSAEVVNVHAAQLGHQPVRDAGGYAAHPEIIDANLAPAADNVISCRDFFQK